MQCVDTCLTPAYRHTAGANTETTPTRTPSNKYGAVEGIFKSDHDLRYAAAASMILSFLFCVGALSWWRVHISLPINASFLQLFRPFFPQRYLIWLHEASIIMLFHTYAEELRREARLPCVPRFRRRPSQGAPSW